MKYLYIFIFILLITLFSAKATVWASESEGIAELRNISGSTERCFAMSLETRPSNFEIQVDCRNLTYPITTDSNNVYIMWAVPIKEGASPVRLGELNFGKITFRTSTPFSSLFVTTEPNNRSRTPSANKIMEGDMVPNDFLETTPQKTTRRATLTPTPTPQPQGGGPLSGVVRAFVTFVAIILGIIIFAIILFVIYRYRKSQS